MIGPGKRLIAALIDAGDVGSFRKMGLIPDLFKDGVERELYDMVSDHIVRYGVVPDRVTVESTVAEKLPNVVEPAEYYRDQVAERYTHNLIRKASLDASEKLKEGKTDDAVGIFERALSNNIRTRKQTQIIDYREAYGHVMSEYVSKYSEGEDYGIQLGWPTVDKMTGGLLGGDVVSYIGRPAAGKAQPLSSKVLLHDGTWACMGDIKRGDQLASVDGMPSEVYGVYPQGMRPVMKITFGDGREVRADEDHLWRVGCKYWDEDRLMTTVQLMRWRGKAKRFKNTMWVDLASGNFGAGGLPLDPYVVGVLIGDGSLTGGRPVFTTEDQQMAREVSRRLPGQLVLEIKRGHRAQSYGITGMSEDASSKTNNVVLALKQLGLWGMASHQKRIPTQSLTLPLESRLDLLRGLMDTDGTVDKNGGTSFCTVSEGLANDVVELVQSLGGQANIALKKTTHRDAYIVHIRLKDRSRLFMLDRKKDRCKDIRKDERRLRIVGIEPDGEEECQCIAVTHPTRLYLTDGYVPTHNTFKMLYSAERMWRLNGKTVMLVSTEMKPILLMQRLAGISSQVNYSMIKKAELATVQLNTVKDTLREGAERDNPFYIVDGGMASSVEQIVLMAQTFRPDVVLVDGAYLIGSRTMPHLKLWERVTRVAEGVKDLLAEPLSIPAICSYQFNREMTKSKNPAGVEHIAGADAIGQLSSLVLGLMEPDSVETLNRRKVDILKGRSGETGEFYINWNFDRMDFSEAAPKSELEFMV